MEVVAHLALQLGAQVLCLRRTQLLRLEVDGAKPIHLLIRRIKRRLSLAASLASALLLHDRRGLPAIALTLGGRHLLLQRVALCFSILPLLSVESHPVMPPDAGTVNRFAAFLSFGEEVVVFRRR